MKKTFFVMIVIVMLLGLIPNRANAAPPYQPYVSVGHWNLTNDMTPAIAQFSAYDVNWKAWKPGILEFGFIYCDDAGCTETIDIRIPLNPQEYHYPQHLDLSAKVWRYVYPSTSCSITQFVRIFDKADTVLAEAKNGPLDLCIGIPPQ